MQIVKIETLISKGKFPSSPEWSKVREEAIEAVKGAEWPPGSGKFTIYPQSGKKSGEGNGVKPIKDKTILALAGGRPSYNQWVKDTRLNSEGGTIKGWVSEYPWPVGERIKPGNMDAAYIGEDGLVCLEWETGNISSSHRSLNKICLGLLTGTIKAGILVVPSRKLYPFLTDRIGNISELEPYFALWRATPCSEGVLEIFVIEHDAESLDVPKIPKGTDGRSKI